MATEQISRGASVDDFCNRQAGGPEARAFALSELEGLVEAAVAEVEYEEGEAAEELRGALAQLDFTLKRLSIMEDGGLTFWRECRRCSGDGKTRGEDPCVECKGRGAIHADEVE